MDRALNNQQDWYAIKFKQAVYRKVLQNVYRQNKPIYKYIKLLSRDLPIYVMKF